MPVPGGPLPSLKLLPHFPAHFVHGRMQDLFFFLGGGACDAWRSHAFAMGVRGHASPKKIFEWCNLVRFGAYFHNFYTFKKSKNIIFLQK